MSTALEIDGKLLHPIKDVVKLVSYSRDYITRLAREEKIVAQHVGRQWFVDIDSLNGYIDSAAIEHEIRKKQLSDSRKLERKVRAVAEEQRPLRESKVKILHVRAVATACLVLGLGLFGGVTAYESMFVQTSSKSQIANTYGTDVLPLVDETKFAARPDDVIRLDAKANNSVSSMGDVKNGILLLPAGIASSSVDDMFSDQVEVQQLEDGTSVVMRVGKDGRAVGNKIPFVMVPVKQAEI